ncbi:eukaryotic translation initiation factor 3 subunit E, partial [Oleoguttula sp. CCFEE 6159]
MADNHPASAETMLDGASSQAHPPQDVAKEYSLLPKLIPHLDRHLVFPLLQFLEDQEAEPASETTKAKFELMKHTNMTDFVGQLYADINGLSERPQEYVKKREEVLQRRELFEQETSKIQELLADAEVTNNLRSDKVANFNYLKEQHGVSTEMMDMLYDYGQFQYSCGDYSSAATLLFQFRFLSTNTDKVDAATWGKFAAEILSTEWEAALEELNTIKDSIDARLFNKPLQQLQQRTWLIHWSLFPFFNHEPAREKLTELFFSPTYINTIQTACPWILRYLVAAVITNRNRSRNIGAYHKQLKDLIRIIKQEGYEYNDPLTDFVKAL